MWATRSSIGLSSSSRVFGERCSPLISFRLDDAFESFDGLLIAVGVDNRNSVGPGFAGVAEGLRGGLYFSAAAFLPSRLSNLRRSGRAATLCRIVSAWGCFLILLLKHCNRTSSTTAATSGRSALR